MFSKNVRTIAGSVRSFEGSIIPFTPVREHRLDKENISIVWSVSKQIPYKSVHTELAATACSFVPVHRLTFERGNRNNRAEFNRKSNSDVTPSSAAMIGSRIPAEARPTPMAVTRDVPTKLVIIVLLA